MFNVGIDPEPSKGVQHITNTVLDAARLLKELQSQAKENIVCAYEFNQQKNIVSGSVFAVRNEITRGVDVHVLANVNGHEIKTNHYVSDFDFELDAQLAYKLLSDEVSKEIARVFMLANADSVLCKLPKSVRPTNI